MNTAITIPSSPSAKAKRASGRSSCRHQASIQLGLAVLVVADRGVQLVHPLERHDRCGGSRPSPAGGAPPPGSSDQLKPKTMLASFSVISTASTTMPRSALMQREHQRQHHARPAGSGRPDRRPCSGRTPGGASPPSSAPSPAASASRSRMSAATALGVALELGVGHRPDVRLEDRPHEPAVHRAATVGDDRASWSPRRPRCRARDRDIRSRDPRRRC